MKSKNIILIGGLSLLTFGLSSFGTAIPLVDKVTYSNEIYGPFFEHEEERTHYVEYKYTGSYILEAYEEVRIMYHDNFADVYVYDYKTPVHSLITNNTYSYYFTFSPISKINNLFGATFEFRVVDLNTGDAIDEKIRDVYFTRPKTYTSIDIEETPKLTPTSYCFTLCPIKEHAQSFDFTNTIFMCKDSPNLYLDVSSIKFIENTKHSLTFDSCFAKISNKNDMFINMEKQGDFVYFPLDIVKDGSTCYFEFKDLYVHPDTLLVSPTQLKGYVPTSKLFFPIEKYKSITPFQFELSIKGLGLAKTNIILVIDYYPTGNLIGECSTSDFCLVGGVNND